ncbi:hypothetical protein FPQ18DRAFT_410752 [Pyronema domesticum]|nr:hypothetical protein FPQ18DRAFT_410752 [Pyronema domesticum]
MSQLSESTSTLPLPERCYNPRSTASPTRDPTTSRSPFLFLLLPQQSMKSSATQITATTLTNTSKDISSQNSPESQLPTRIKANKDRRPNTMNLAQTAITLVTQVRFHSQLQSFKPPERVSPISPVSSVTLITHQHEASKQADLSTAYLLDHTIVINGGPANYQGAIKLPPPQRNPGCRARKETQQVPEIQAEFERPFYEPYSPYYESDSEISKDSGDYEMDEDSETDDEDYIASLRVDFDLNLQPWILMLCLNESNATSYQVNSGTRVPESHPKEKHCLEEEAFENAERIKKVKGLFGPSVEASETTTAMYKLFTAVINNRLLEPFTAGIDGSDTSTTPPDGANPRLSNATFHVNERTAQNPFTNNECTHKNCQYPHKRLATETGNLRIQGSATGANATNLKP